MNEVKSLEAFEVEDGSPESLLIDYLDAADLDGAVVVKIHKDGAVSVGGVLQDEVRGTFADTVFKFFMHSNEELCVRLAEEIKKTG
jgi:hypothetical protein